MDGFGQKWRRYTPLKWQIRAGGLLSSLFLKNVYLLSWSQVEFKTLTPSYHYWDNVLKFLLFINTYPEAFSHPKTNVRIDFGKFSSDWSTLIDNHGWKPKLKVLQYSIGGGLSFNFQTKSKNHINLLQLQIVDRQKLACKVLYNV